MNYKGVDDLLEKALSTGKDEERKNLYAQIQRKVIEDCIIIPIYYEAQIMPPGRTWTSAGCEGQ